MGMDDVGDKVELLDQLVEHRLVEQDNRISKLHSLLDYQQKPP
jgi:hypothetical protein